MPPEEVPTKIKSLEVESLIIKAPGCPSSITLMASRQGTGIWVTSGSSQTPFAAIYIDPATKNPVIQLMNPANITKLHGADFALSLDDKGVTQLQYADGNGHIKIVPVNSLVSTCQQPTPPQPEYS